MTTPAKRKSGNINRSILRFIKTNFEDAYSLSGKVNYRDETFDASELDQWVDLDFIEESAGQKGFTMLQASICSRVQGRHSSGDRYGIKLLALADQLQSAMEGGADGIQLYDYSVTPSAPTIITNRKAIVVNSSGVYGQPEENRKMDPENGILRRVLTYRFITLSDVARASRFYD